MASSPPGCLATAVANSQLSTVKSLVEDDKVDVNAPGPDGTTPLCAAALWGDDKMVDYLLELGADANAVNTGTGWSALHAAAFQEHGLIIRRLLAAGSDPELTDAKGRTPKDFASISEATWPFFQAVGCVRSTKRRLVDVGIVRQVPSRGDSSHSLGSASTASSAGPPSPSRLPPGSIRQLSRPGSAYVRVSIDPMARPASGVDKAGRPKGGYAGFAATRAPAGSVSPVDAVAAGVAAIGIGALPRTGSSGDVDPLAAPTAAGAGRAPRPPPRTGSASSGGGDASLSFGSLGL